MERKKVSYHQRLQSPQYPKGDRMDVDKLTTAVEDIERNAPTNTPSEGLPPHNYKIIKLHKFILLQTGKNFWQNSKHKR